MKSLYFIVTTLFLMHYSLFAQNPSENYLGSWYTFDSAHRLSERWSLSPYGELRFYEPSSNYNLAFASLRTNYHLSPSNTLGVGYAYLDIDTVFEFDHAPNVKEHRLFEQYTYKHRLGKFKILHRFRLEQRFLDFSTRHDAQHRLRYRISFKYDLNKTIYLALSEEPFMNFQDQVFHENRFYTGIGFNILKHAQFHIGYLKQHIRKNNLNRIQVGFSFQTDSRPAKPSSTSL